MYPGMGLIWEQMDTPPKGNADGERNGNTRFEAFLLKSRKLSIKMRHDCDCECAAIFAEKTHNF